MATKHIYENLRAENKRLQAVNAELLAALKAVVNGAFATAITSAAVEQARAAIRKADGK